jgi:hypothetical protein
MLCLAIGTWAATPVKYEVENHVYVATDGNLHDLIDETDFVLLAFGSTTELLIVIDRFS